MIKIEIKSKGLVLGLSNLERKQMPFAMALGINDLTKEIKTEERPRISRDLDRPTPFTQNGMFIRRASKRNLEGMIGYKDIQSEYLSRQASGGIRRAKGRAILVPVGIRLNKYGNMPRGSIRRSLARPDVFSGKVGNVAGIWKRPRRSKRRRSGKVGTVGKSKGLTLLAAYKSKVRYQPRYKFEPNVRLHATRRIGPLVSARLRKAMLTAK